MGKYVHICSIYKLLASIRRTVDCTHTLQTTFHGSGKYYNKYGCHIAKKGYTAFILYRNIDIPLVDICATTQPNAVPTSQIFALYVPETNIPPH